MAEIKIWHKFFYFACMLCSIYYCSILTHKYLLNESSAQITIHTRGESTQDGHPAITICLHADGGNVFSNIDNDKRKTYYDAMYGKGKATRKMLQTGGFKKPTKQPSFYIKRLQLDYDDEVNLTEFKLKNINDTYVDPDDHCFTFESTSINSGALQEALFVFRTKKLQTLKDGRLMVFLHHPGQFVQDSGLMRSFVYHVQNVDRLNDTIDTRNMAKIQINQIKLLKNRPNGHTKCNESLENQDAEWMDAVKQLFNCTPPYWRYLWDGDKYPPT